MHIQFAQMLQKARLRKGLSQSRLAQLVGVSQQSISAYECGRSCPPDIAVIFARVLDDYSLLQHYCASCYVGKVGGGCAELARCG
ncbi:helix-turn-helix transcriptional regulator [Caldanaerobius polysaccharolyticus]|uniref:helix-turn-helix transcriptional regulator n=1 Tax=Caldanaerobius polysaccharolyticus TaxID=44256 RepID=UPI000556B015|nr:helix-turn-helix transcriptional regulator [Caldanaerobius polysaccharolyticus]